MSKSTHVPYVDSHERVTGSISYVLNLAVPGMLHAAITRSTRAHAKLISIDVGPALDVPGVVAVLTGQDLRAVGVVSPFFGPVFKDQPILAIDKVRYVGEPVAAVAAIDSDLAQYAAALIEIDYDDVPAAFDIEHALLESAPVIHDELARSPAFPDIILHETPGTNYLNHFFLGRGDEVSAFDRSDLVCDDVFVTSGTQHVPLEPHVVLVEAPRGTDITVWSATQTPYIVRAELAQIFDIPQSRVRVRVPTLGGGYGAKTYTKLEPLIVALSRKAEAPVKLVLARDEEFVTVKNHESIVRIKTGVARDGKLIAREVESWWDAGAYADISPRFIMFAGFYGPGPYRIANVKIRSHAVYTNKPPSAAFRGFSAPQNAYAFECQMDAIAERLGIDPIDLRFMNLLESGDYYATGEQMQDLHFKELLTDAADAIGRGTDAEDADLPPQMKRGKGLGIMMMGTITPSTSSASVKVNSDGSVNVLSSTVEMGQGSRTALAQITADTLRVPLETVSVVDPDTDVTPFDLTTSASRSTFLMGEAVRLAGEDAASELRRLAADKLEVLADDLELRDGGVFVTGTTRGATFGELITDSQSGTLLGRGTYTTTGGLNPEDGQGIASAQWHQCAAGAEVVVDLETGFVEVKRLHVNTYTGKTINVTNAELQLEGAAIFGLGAALLEEMHYDGGQIVNANLADYLVPSFLDVGGSLTTSLLEHTGSESEVHGIGENGVGPVPAAIGNAVHAAIGVRIPDLPITPEKVLRALSSLKEKSSHDEGGRDEGETRGK